MTNLKAYHVWDAHVRWFHWINLLCMLGLIAVGVTILNAKALGVTNEGK